MKIIKIFENELLEGYERADEKFVRAYAFASIVAISWIIVIYLFTVGFLYI